MLHTIVTIGIEYMYNVYNKELELSSSGKVDDSKSGGPIGPRFRVSTRQTSV